MSLDSYLKDLRNLEASLESEIENIIKENQGKLLWLIKNRLFNHGVDAFGKEIRPTYARSTIEEKKSKNQRTSFVTLRDKGEFYAGIFVEVQNYIITVGSTDGKTDSLISKYGEGILGFTKDEQDYIIFSIIEPHVNKLLNQLGGGTIELGK